MRVHNPHGSTRMCLHAAGCRQAVRATANPCTSRWACGGTDTPRVSAVSRGCDLHLFRGSLQHHSGDPPQSAFLPMKRKMKASPRKERLPASTARYKSPKEKKPGSVTSTPQKERGTD